MILLRQFQTTLSAPSLAGATFIAFAGASIAWSSGDYVWSITLLLTWVIAYWLGTRAVWPEPIWIGYCFAMMVPLVLLLLGDNSPIVFNQNYLGCALALALAGAVAYELWWFLPFGGAGVWLSQSRGAILATGVLTFVSLWRWSRLIAVCVALCVLIIAVSVSGEHRDGGLLPRLGVWQETLNHLTLLGSGFGSFFETYWSWPTHINTNANFSRAQHAYNDVLELIFELGIGTTPLWVLLILAWEGTDERAKLVLVTFAALGLTFFPLFIPVLGHLAAFSVGQLVASRHPKETYYALST